MITNELDHKKDINPIYRCEKDFFIDISIFSHCSP